MTEALSVTAVLDASVLYPALLRNMLMRLALHGLFFARVGRNEFTGNG